MPGRSAGGTASPRAQGRFFRGDNSLEMFACDYVQDVAPAIVRWHTSAANVRCANDQGHIFSGTRVLRLILLGEAGVTNDE